MFGKCGGGEGYIKWNAENIFYTYNQMSLNSKIHKSKIYQVRIGSLDIFHE